MQFTTNGSALFLKTEAFAGRKDPNITYIRASFLDEDMNNFAFFITEEQEKLCSTLNTLTPCSLVVNAVNRDGNIRLSLKEIIV